jgi:hypothetical protein
VRKRRRLNLTFECYVSPLILLLETLEEIRRLLLMKEGGRCLISTGDLHVCGSHADVAFKSISVLECRF